MSILFDNDKKIFKLDTNHTSYVIGLTPEGYVGHIYYGKKLNSICSNDLLRIHEAPFSPSVNAREKCSFLDTFPMEYPAGGTGDFRESCLDIENETGSTACDFFYQSHSIIKGKPHLKDLPASFGDENSVETLTIVCVDPILNLTVELSYSAFFYEDIITRNVRLINNGQENLHIHKVYSACIDMDNMDFECMSLFGSWARERHIQRNKLVYGRQNVSSYRGCSSHQEHPFLALVTPNTTQTTGDVYAMNFVYSGNFLAQAELSQFDQVRMVMGIHSDRFSWNLLPNESFQAPEVVLTYSQEGLGKMTRNFHDFYRNHLIRSPYLYKKRPVLINNWEATYFNFNSDKLIDIAKDAKKAGIELFVMDDGWFGKRNSDNCSLGDWIVDKNKIPEGLSKLVERVNEIGLDFGIWFEPEMISPDSDLYRSHPDWAIQIKGRTATLSREQYILDLSRQEVIDYVYECVANVLRTTNIVYIKWDMNRQFSDVGSFCLSKDFQGELFHRYILGVYQLQERLITEFPNLLLENCASGGARFDPAMLYYSPQIWCSDDTDAIERLRIQEGTALIYPLSCIGAHVSDCPNHTVGRTTPFKTRGDVALCGTFGYELDITKIPSKDREQIPGQIKTYHKYQKLIQQGDYYRLNSWTEQSPYDAWALVSKDKDEVLLTCVQVLQRANVHSKKIYLQGLDETKKYQLEGSDRTFYGEELMNCGFLIQELHGDFSSTLYHFVTKTDA